MTSISSNRLCRALWLPALLLAFAAEAQPFSTTNALSRTNAAPAAIPRRASIILVVADGLGCGDLSCYGQTNFQTPNLGKLAAEGTRFTGYSAGDLADSPARAALMLGKDSGHLRQRADADIPLAPEDVTVAQMLKNAGYRTCLVGEWNLGSENSSGAPWRKGFDEFGGYLDANDAANFYADYIWRFAQNETYDESYNDPVNGHWRRWDEKAAIAHLPGKSMIYANTQGKNQFIPDTLTQAALNFMKIGQPDAANRYRPFFLVVNYRIPADGKSAVPTDAPFSEEPWPQPAKNKAAMILRLDGYIGQMMEQLKKLGMTNNAAVFFTSASVPLKNAAVSPDFFHSTTSANDLHVPMIAHWPGRIPAGKVSNFKWSAPDFLPTAAGIGFAKPPEGITGVSAVSALAGKAKK